MTTDVQIECICPPKADGQPRHQRDTVTLRDTLEFRSVTAIRTNIGLLEDGSDVADLMAVLTEGYLVYGVESWTLVDEKGKPVPVTRRTVLDVLLADVGAASTVGDAADEVFGEKVMLPLLNRAETSSPPTPTEPTSPPSADSTASSRTRKSRTPSRPSSTTTTRTDGIAATFSSPGGEYSSSQSSTPAD